MSSNERLDLIAEKVNQLRQELAALGFETSFFFRAPGSAKEPIAYLLIVETWADVEKSRRNERL